MVALFGGLHPAGIVAAAAFVGLLLVGADMTQRAVGLPANVILVLQEVIPLAIVSARAFLANPYARDRALRAVSRLRSPSARHRASPASACRCWGWAWPGRSSVVLALARRSRALGPATLGKPYDREARS